MNNSSIKTNLYRKRQEKGLTQSEMAELLNISQTAYQKIETGNTALISNRISQLADALQIEEEELVLGYIPEQSIDSYTQQEVREDAYSKFIDIIKGLESQIHRQTELIISLNHRIEELNKDRNYDRGED